jgi:hypothetical protein
MTTIIFRFMRDFLVASAAGVSGSDANDISRLGENVGISERIICVPTPSPQDQDPFFTAARPKASVVPAQSSPLEAGPHYVGATAPAA